MSDFGVIIPARFGSTRLPGKVLRDLAGRPMIQWVVENAQKSGAQFVWVATDDERVASTVRAFGGEAIMTSRDPLNGSERLAEVVRQRGLPPETLIVNVQGDEPLLAPDLVTLVADQLAAFPEAGVSTLATPIESVEELFNPHVVKVLVNARGRAIYFSRAPLPWVRGSFSASEIPKKLPENIVFLRHIGLYAYRAQALLRLSQLSAPPEEKAESLEQLRALHYGIPIVVTTQASAPARGVDTEEDWKVVNYLLS